MLIMCRNKKKNQKKEAIKRTMGFFFFGTGTAAARCARIQLLNAPRDMINLPNATHFIMGNMQKAY